MNAAPGSPLLQSAERALLGVLLVAFAAIVIRSAWLCDDAYITFRSVDHLVSGHGLRWNVSERVQAYTHPLWMGLLALNAAATGDFEIAPLVLSVSLSLTAVLVLALRIASGPGAAIVAVSVLTLSRAFVDYSTSGLENPLSHLLLVCFALAYFEGTERLRDRTERSERWQSWDSRVLLCFGIAGLAVLCRMDTALLYAPALATLLILRRSPRAVGLALLALSPLFSWLAFSLFYYGFALPNTVPAKLGTGIPGSALMAQGLVYLRASIVMDPITPVAIAAGGLLGALRRGPGSALALGVLVYLVYVVRIGGDFMAGRHLTLPLLGAVILLARSLPRSPLTTAAGLAASLSLGMLAPHPTLFGDAWIYRGNPIFEVRGVKDERSVYAPYTAPWNGYERREHPWAEQGRRARRRAEAVVPRAAIGLFAFHAGPEVHVVDVNALGDPLLARLPARERGASGWRIGHHTRDLPDGYLESLRSGENRIRDPQLAELYERLVLVTRAELLSLERLREIARLATGRSTGRIEALD